MDELSKLGFANVSLLVSPGIYVLCYQGEVVYIGQSTNPLMRIGQHGYNIKFDQVFFRKCKADELITLERLLIKKLKPKANRVVEAHIPCAKHEHKGSWMDKQQQRFSDDSVQISAIETIKIGSFEINLPKKQAR